MWSQLCFEVLVFDWKNAISLPLSSNQFLPTFHHNLFCHLTLMICQFKTIFQSVTIGQHIVASICLLENAAVDNSYWTLVFLILSVTYGLNFIRNNYACAECTVYSFLKYPVFRCACAHCTELYTCWVHYCHLNYSELVSLTNRLRFIYCRKEKFAFAICVR